MHPNPAFRGADAARNLAFARTRSFGMLTAAGGAGPLAAHVPFVLDEDGATADLHLVRSNPLARALRDEPLHALLAVIGPDGYVSPDWYGVEDQVPTWNYVAVHLRGTLSLRPQETLHAHLEALSAHMEGMLEKHPWTMDKNQPETLAKLQRMIVPARLEIAEVDGTWKLAQNKPDAARVAAADGVETSFGAELSALAALMRTPPA